MRLTQGDVILRRGNFALVWDILTSRRMLVFPIVDAREGFAPHDVVVQGWQEFAQVSRIPAIAIKTTAARFVDPIDWLKLPDLALNIKDICGIYRSLINFSNECGTNLQWPYMHSAREDKAPIFAS